MPGTRTPRLPFVEATKAKGRLYLYYRRDGRRLPLPGPEGGAEFLSEYDRIHAEFENPAGSSDYGRHTVGAAIELYLASAEFSVLGESSRRNYRYYLNEMRGRAGHVLLAEVTDEWLDKLRDRLAGRPHYWNALLSRMRVVFDKYHRQHRAVLPQNPWREAARLGTEESTQNRRWPDHVLTLVLREATPEFRALLVTLLLTAQRVGDVVALRPGQYDPKTRTLGYVDGFDQEKTGKAMVLHVPDALAEIFAAVRGRHPDRLLVTPRGKAWTVVNAEETLLSLRRRLELPRYTLHGLRATGPQALKMLGVENRPIRAVTGHDSDRNLEIYLKGVENYEMARDAQEKLARRYSEILASSLEGANGRRFSGLTGRAATKRGGARPVTEESAKPLPNAKPEAPNAKNSQPNQWRPQRTPASCFRQNHPDARMAQKTRKIGQRTAHLSPRCFMLAHSRCGG